MTDVRNVVLVHGGFVDGSGWQPVYRRHGPDRRPGRDPRPGGRQAGA
jgi:hypothetical protein